jgi:hypothetical protein
VKISTLSKQFAVNETRWVACPFVRDFEVDLARIGCEEWVERMRERSQSNELLKETTNIAYRAQVLRRAGVKDDQLVSLADNLDIAARLGETLETDTRKQDVAECLMRNWRGELVEGIPYSPAEGVEMLSDTAPLGVDIELLADPQAEEDSPSDDNLTLLSNLTLGSALSLWIQWEAARQERFREGWIEEQEKNSLRLSASAPA